VIPDRKIARALVVVAHPDDVDFWARGTVASWTSAGIAVAYLVLTDGDSGGFDPRIPRSAIPDIRREEQEAAASELGVDDVRFLGYPDGRLAPSYRLRRDITRVIRQVRPERVLTWTPEWSWRRFHRNHPDHRAVGEAVLSAVFPDAPQPVRPSRAAQRRGAGALGGRVEHHLAVAAQSVGPPWPGTLVCNPEAWSRLALMDSLTLGTAGKPHGGGPP
jgi:LmbE family N-acetylglucosaminyl deacetylase